MPASSPSLPAGASIGGLRIVGLGDSAGGLEPRAHFLASVPAASGLAYGAVQHMDPRT